MSMLKSSGGSCGTTVTFIGVLTTHTTIKSEGSYGNVCGEVDSNLLPGIMT